MFSNLSPISKAISKEFSLTHLNGDLHQISAISDDWQANTHYEIVFYGNTPLISESVFFPNYLLVNESGDANVIASTTDALTQGHQLPRPKHLRAFLRPEQLLRYSEDKVAIANASERFERFTARSNSASARGNDTAAHNTHNTHNTEDSQHSLKQKNTHRIIPSIQNANWTSSELALPLGVQLPAFTNLPSQEQEGIELAVRERFRKNGLSTSSRGVAIEASIDSSLKTESYALSLANSGINITYADSAGLYYALMSIAQLYDTNTQTLPVGLANDGPNMAFRGLHIDVSRNFRSKDFILQTLDQMSYFKLNKLHLHLADDEGWRLQIASLPELTSVGAFRCFDETENDCLLPQLAGGDGKLATAQQNSGYYSINDYIDILRYAQARQIEVLPSFDMPGHSRAAIVSMNARYSRLMAQGKPEEAKQYFLTELADTSEYSSIQHYNDNTLNPCITATYTFVEEVLAQLTAMHKTAGVALKHYHIGADETAGAWTNSPACAALIAQNPSLSDVKQLGPYFIEAVAQKVSALGITPAAWSDGLSYANADNLPAKVQANAWETLYSGGHSKAHTMINKGWKVVLSTPDVLYFDFPYEADPIEPGYYWGSRFTDSYQVFQFMPHNLPVHAQLWRDNFGRPYAANADVDKKDGRQIHGIQAQLWGETVRSNKVANYMLFPRLLAVAERAWFQAPWAETYQAGKSYTSTSDDFDESQMRQLKNDWYNFSKVLSTKAMVQLVKEGVEPRVALPGAVFKAGILHMQSPLAGLVLEYQVDNGRWQTYESAVNIPAQSVVKIRSRIPTTPVISREQIVQTAAL